jgi:hypothetical protein
VNYSAKLKVISSLLAVLLAMSTDVAWSLTTQLAQGDGSTVTVEVDPLAKYRDATQLSEDELIDLLKIVGFKGKALKVAWAAAMKESRGHPTSHNKNSSTGDDSYGLFQVNMIGSLGVDRLKKFQENGIDITSKQQLLDPVLNAKVVLYMTNDGVNWGSWGYGPHAYDGDPSEPGIQFWLSKFPEQ